MHTIFRMNLEVDLTIGSSAPRFDDIHLFQTLNRFGKLASCMKIGGVQMGGTKEKYDLKGMGRILKKSLAPHGKIILIDRDSQLVTNLADTIDKEGNGEKATSISKMIVQDLLKKMICLADCFDINKEHQLMIASPFLIPNETHIAIKHMDLHDNAIKDTLALSQPHNFPPIRYIGVREMRLACIHRWGIQEGNYNECLEILERPYPKKDIQERSYHECVDILEDTYPNNIHLVHLLGLGYLLSNLKIFIGIQDGLLEHAQGKKETTQDVMSNLMEHATVYLVQEEIDPFQNQTIDPTTLDPNVMEPFVYINEPAINVMGYKNKLNDDKSGLVSIPKTIDEVHNRIKQQENQFSDIMNQMDELHTHCEDLIKQVNEIHLQCETSTKGIASLTAEFTNSDLKTNLAQDSYKELKSEIQSTSASKADVKTLTDLITNVHRHQHRQFNSILEKTETLAANQQTNELRQEIIDKNRMTKELVLEMSTLCSEEHQAYMQQIEQFANTIDLKQLKDIFDSFKNSLTDLPEDMISSVKKSLQSAVKTAIEEALAAERLTETAVTVMDTVINGERVKKVSKKKRKQTKTKAIEKESDSDSSDEEVKQGTKKRRAKKRKSPPIEENKDSNDSSKEERVIKYRDEDDSEVQMDLDSRERFSGDEEEQRPMGNRRVVVLSEDQGQKEDKSKKDKDTEQGEVQVAEASVQEEDKKYLYPDSLQASSYVSWNYINAVKENFSSARSSVGQMFQEVTQKLIGDRTLAEYEIQTAEQAEGDIQFLELWKLREFKEELSGSTYFNIKTYSSLVKYIRKILGLIFYHIEKRGKFNGCIIEHVACNCPLHVALRKIFSLQKELTKHKISRRRGFHYKTFMLKIYLVHLDPVVKEVLSRGEIIMDSNKSRGRPEFRSRGRLATKRRPSSMLRSNSRGYRPYGRSRSADTRRSSSQGRELDFSEDLRYNNFEGNSFKRRKYWN